MSKSENVDRSGASGLLSGIHPAPMVEIMPPDWATAFNSVAPYVTEARAFLASGDAESARRSLDEACDRIKLAGVTMVKCDPAG